MRRTDTITDPAGNAITFSNDGEHIGIMLKLASEKKARSIGTIIIRERVLTIGRERAKHFFRKHGGYGMNFKLVNEGKTFDTVRLIDEYSEWNIPKQFIIEHGKFLNFVNHGGFETQIFIRLTEIEEFSKMLVF